MCVDARQVGEEGREVVGQQYEIRFLGCFIGIQQTEGRSGRQWMCGEVAASIGVVSEEEVADRCGWVESVRIDRYGRLEWR